jgi:predicted transcriptional regulator
MFNKPITITNIYSTVVKHNSLSGHSWSENEKIIGYEVDGGGCIYDDIYCPWLTSKHRTLSSAKKEFNKRVEIYKFQIKTYDFDYLNNLKNINRGEKL